MPYSAKFERCFEKLMVNEGGFAHLQGDSGGRTWYGVSETYQPTYFARMDAAETDEERLSIARECYFFEYWTPLHCEEFPAAVAFRLLDGGVLTGRGTIVKCLQRACNLDGAGLAVDGRLGPKTLAAATRISANHWRNVVGWMTWYLGEYFMACGTYVWGWGARLVEPD